MDDNPFLILIKLDVPTLERQIRNIETMKKSRVYWLKKYESFLVDAERIKKEIANLKFKIEIDNIEVNQRRVMIAAKQKG